MYKLQKATEYVLKIAKSIKFQAPYTDRFVIY